MGETDKHEAHCHICGIPKIVIASINTHKRVSQVSDFYMLLTETSFRENLKVKVSFNMIQKHSLLTTILCSIVLSIQCNLL